MSGEASDEDLLKAVASADRAAACWLVERHARAVHRVAQALVGDTPSADDATQETFARMLASAATFDPRKGSGRSWILGVARNVALEQLRKRREIPAGAPGATESLLELGVAAGWGSTESPESATLRAESREQLARALASLAPHDREILVLREIEGLEGAEVATILGLDLAATKSRLHRARLRLVAAMAGFTEGIMSVERLAGGLRCREVIAVLSEYVDDELGATDRVRVEDHLRGCTICETFGGRFSRTVESIRAKLGGERAVSPELVAALIVRLR